MNEQETELIKLLHRHFYELSKDFIELSKTFQKISYSISELDQAIRVYEKYSKEH